MSYLSEFGTVFISTARDVLPIVIIMMVFQVLVLKQAIANIKKLTIGIGYVLIGLTFFLIGLDEALFPLGRLMSKQLTDPYFIGFVAGQTVDWTMYYWVYCFAFLIGFSTTIAEPSLLAVAIKANMVSGGTISAWGLRIAVAIGVAIGITLGTFRIVTGLPIYYFIITGYIVVMVQTLFSPKAIVPLAYDTGGVTTSTVTVPLVAALGLGLAETVPGRSPLIDGFGLIAFASVFPIISVLAYAQITHFLAQRKEKTHAL